MDKVPHPTVYEIWLTSRQSEQNGLLPAGAQRPLNWRNAKLVLLLLNDCILDLLRRLWSAQPARTALFVVLHLAISLFPAFRGYSQALIIDEIQSLVSSGSFNWSRILRLVTTELVRRALETSIHTLASANEHRVLGSAKILVERHQIELRVRLDAPTLADPSICELLHESDLFSRSFHGGGFGLSPYDFLQIFGHLSEIISHFVLLCSIKSTTHLTGLLLSIISMSLPALLPSFGLGQGNSDSLYGPREAEAARRLEKMRNLAFNDSYRPEVTIFGLGDWILDSWTEARRTIFKFDNSHHDTRPFFADLGISDLVFAFQNIPVILLLQTSQATSLGTLTLYRNSIQSIILSFRSLVATSRMAFQAIFLMAAYSASLNIRPKLQPKPQDAVEYQSGEGGMRIQVKSVSYTYPGGNVALRDINFTLEKGETLAIVGYNGSGKTTLAKVLLRLIDFDEGQIFINDVNFRLYNPVQYHKRLSAVFQNFSKFNLTMQENVGLGLVDQISCESTIRQAIHLAEADAIADDLPLGLETTLESPGFESIPWYPGSSEVTNHHHGLSGGEWQRLALARSFMRITSDTDLILFDEPTSSLDAHAQHQIFDTIHKLSHRPSRVKTVIFITHRLSTARRADKIAMMEGGTITEFGTHEQLLEKGGSYASLYELSL